ncbi:MAG: cobalamin-dependent protein [Candidatus Sulfotelmatobacter sp.]
METHPKKGHARILLSSVFGPYAQDDEFGSRSINPMELYHNQVTRAQGSFSLRMFHRSWGIMMIQENILASCNVLDFPTREAFAQELTTHHYDIVGISSIIVNVLKVREMCCMVRELSPDSLVVVGGHVAAIPGLETMIDTDHIVRGEGIFLDAPLPGRRRGRTNPPSRHCFRSRNTHHGNPPPESQGRNGRNDHHVGGAPHGVQFLHYISFFWW